MEGKVTLAKAAKEAALAVFVIVLVGALIGGVAAFCILLAGAGFGLWSGTPILIVFFVLLTAGRYFHDRM